MIVLGVAFIFYALYLLWRGGVAVKQNQLRLVPRTDKTKPRIAVLIPARDESAVIEGLIMSLEAQTIGLKSHDVYVIVETIADPTVAICARHHNQVIVRRHLEQQRKGYALDEAVKEILNKGEHYDLYFVFDADNLLDKDYFEKMLESYHAGYELATGYRNPKNGSVNLIAAVSSLTFSMINVMSNHRRAQYSANIIFSGTGFYVDGEIVEEWGGWPFHSLTEDYEMSLYAALHGIVTYYNESANFYDEQPTKYHQTVAQRVRWIKGYFMARKKYIPLMRDKKRARNYGSLVKEMIGVRPIIWAIIGVVLVFLGGIVWLVLLDLANLIWIVALGLLVIIYLILMIITIIMLKRERFELKRGLWTGVVLFNPLYLLTYIPCAIKALLTRDVTWKKIKHGK